MSNESFGNQVVLGMKNVRNQSGNDCAGIRDKCGRLLIDQGEVKSRERKYFDDLLNARVKGEVEVNIN